MVLNFGDNKIAINSGIDKSQFGCVKFEKLFKPNNNDEGNKYDIPVILRFKTTESIDTVIEALQYARGLMENE